MHECVRRIPDSVCPLFPPFLPLSPFKVTHNQNPQSWTINELISHCDQEERRLKEEGQLNVNFVSHRKSSDNKIKDDSTKHGKRKGKAKTRAKKVGYRNASFLK